MTRTPLAQATSADARQAHGRSAGRRPRRGRTILAVVLLVLTVACLALSALSAFNWSAQRSYAAVSSQLRSNISAARSGSKKVADLQASQQGVTAELEDLSSSRSVQVRQLSQAVITATATSRKLDRILSLMATGKSWEQATKQAATKKSASPADGRTSSSPSGTSGASGSQAQDEAEKKQEEQQRKKLDQLISRTQSSTDSTLKPW
jgi:hypothetical protein